MLRINNVKVHLNETDARNVIAAKLNIRKREIQDVKILRRSIDARRSKVFFNCSYAFSCAHEEALLAAHKELQPYVPYVYTYPQPTAKRVMVVGSGPAGLFCAYVLAKAGVKVTLVERGKCVEERVKDVDDLFEKGIIHPESNIAFGEGGAGTFSDGKLTTGTKNKRIRYILDEFIKHGAPKEIGYDALPHIGTDRLRQVLIAMRQDLMAHGGEVRFETKFVDFKVEGDKHFVCLKQQGKEHWEETDDLVLAIGHSARDTYAMLAQKLTMHPKAFAVGVRIEQLQEDINKHQYKQDYRNKHLKAAPYKLAVRTSEGRGVYTFCMCPGGVVVPSTEEDGLLCINGMSYYARDGQNANSAILVNVSPEDFGLDDVLAGVAFQKDLERRAYALGGGNLSAPVQKVVDYMQGEVTTSFGKVLPTYRPGTTFADLNQVFPEVINRNLKEGLQLMNERFKGFYDEDTLITAVESRSSAPVRIERDENMSAQGWIYPIGEGAGYAGGIMSSAVDGILCAEKICEG